jgi:hypothetical protein
MRPLKDVVLVVSFVLRYNLWTHNTTDSAKPSYLFEWLVTTEQVDNGTIEQSILALRPLSVYPTKNELRSFFGGSQNWHRNKRPPQQDLGLWSL